MVDKICILCNTEKIIDNFYIKTRKCQVCNMRRVLKRLYIIKEKILQQRPDKIACFKDLDTRLKAWEEKLSVYLKLS